MYVRASLLGAAAAMLLLATLTQEQAIFIIFNAATVESRKKSFTYIHVPWHNHVFKKDCVTEGAATHIDTLMVLS